MNENQQSAKPKNRASSIRWQGRTIEQFGYALNLILGLSVAAMGFEVSLLLRSDFEKDGWQNWLFAASLLSLLLSTAVGLWCVVNRLHDFRTTTETARKRENGAPASELHALRSRSRNLGKRTWRLFWWQISAFGAGVFLLILAVGGQVAKTVTG